MFQRYFQLAAVDQIISYLIIAEVEINSRCHGQEIEAYQPTSNLIIAFFIGTSTV